MEIDFHLPAIENFILVIDRITLRQWQFCFLTFLLVSLIFSQFALQTLGRSEVYPFYTWTLYTSPPRSAEDFVLVLSHWRGKSVVPCSITECPFLPRRKVKDTGPYGLVQNYGDAFLGGKPERADRLLLDIRNYLLGGDPTAGLELKRRKIRNVKEFVFGREDAIYETIAVVGGASP